MRRNNKINVKRNINRKKSINNKFLSICIVVSMIFTAFATVLAIQGPSIKAEVLMNRTPSVRIYGEQGAVYPTQSYSGEDDFVYPEEHDPFDPGIIEKDSITFNSAYWYGHDEYEIKARGDASEEIFLRAFYEPGYTHPIDSLMDGCSDLILQPVEQFDAIVTETTYFLVTLDDRQPNYGFPGETRIVLPYASSDPDYPGMEEAGLLDVTYIDNMGTMQLTDGSVAVEKEYQFLDDSYIGTTLQFMDHKITILNFEENEPPQENQLDIEFSYIGNMYDAASSPSINTVWVGPLNSYFDRYNHKQSITDPCYRWYLRVVNAESDYLRIVLGRRLVAGETFYVDGVRYDIPAVYVNQEGGFKYITLQTPIPKGDTIWEPELIENVHDWSHVPSQYLASLPDNTLVWLLPPFNEEHIMIDDIGLQKTTPHNNYNCLPKNGIILDEEKGPIEFFYIDEDIEERFESTLMERLNTNENNEEEWHWYNVYTKPNRYTEFILPDQETTDDYYDPDDLHGYPYTIADGNEFLISTSLIAPNSEVDTNRSGECKDFYEHEIYDRVKDIALNSERADYYEMPRFVFKFDAYNDIDFFINDDQGPSVRIFGEQDAVYPTQSYSEEYDFVYPEEYNSFDPGIIEKDSITFNSAYWYGHDEYEIKARGDASEEIFLRAFYEPGYTHPIDAKMNDCSYALQPVEQFDAIVTESTYFLVTLDDRQPNYGFPGETRIVLPYASSNPDYPGMEEAGLLDVTYIDNMGTMQLTDGVIEVEKEFVFEDINYTEDITIRLMDHEIIVKNFEDDDPDDQIDIEVFYIGNMNNEATASKLQTVQEGPFNFYFDRSNNKAGTSDACYRWYLRVVNAESDYLRIVLGRRLVAGETFYVDGVRYDIPAVYVNQEGGFKYITLQTPIPKGDTIWEPELIENVHDWSHVSSQYLASLPDNTLVWLLPPFNEEHVMIDDIGLQKLYPHSGSNCLPIAGIILEDEKEPLEFYYIAEDIEERFESSLMERLNTNDYDEEEWYWYNVYTKPNRYTEFILPDQETTDDYYDPDDLHGYPYTIADGNEFLISTSLIAPNSEKDDDPSDQCKYYDEHEIISNRGIDDNGGVSAQFAMILDGSASIITYDWNIMKQGLANAVRNYIPRGIELTVIQFSDSARVEVGPVILTDGNAETIATQIENIAQYMQQTNLTAGISLATTTLAINAAYYDRQIVNIVTDGEPNVGNPDPYTAAEIARDTMIFVLGLDPYEDEIDAEGVGISEPNKNWLRDNIVWPQPGYDYWPPAGPGWIRIVSDYTEFSESISEKFEVLFYRYDPRFTYEFDAADGTGLYINSPPSIPPNSPIINGPKSGKPGTTYSYTFVSVDSDDDDVKYFINWGDNTSEWTGYNASGTEVTVNHAWSNEGTYNITAKAQDINGAESGWSEFEVEIEKSRNRATSYSLFLWFLERLPLLEKLLSLIRVI